MCSCSTHCSVKERNNNEVEKKKFIAEQAEKETVALYHQSKPQIGRTSKGKLTRNTKGTGMDKKGSKAETEVEEVLQDDLVVLKPIYISRLPLSASKYKDLRHVCENTTIPK